MAIFRVFIVTLALVVATVPAAMAQSFTVTVSGTTYNVVGLGIGQSFVDNENAIRAAPWWGDNTLSESIAAQVRVESGPTPWHALYAVSINQVDAVSSNVLGTVWTSESSTGPPADQEGDFSIDTRATVFFGESIQLFTGSVVPELDAPALLQALFILLAFGLWLRTRRTA